MDKINASAVVFYDNQKRVLMLYRHKSTFGEKWGFVGGSIDNNEDPESAVRREVFEELGYKTTNMQFLKKYESQYSSDVKGRVYIYLSVFPGFDAFTSTEEGDVRKDLKLFSVDEARKLKAFPVVQEILNDVEVFLNK